MLTQTELIKISTWTKADLFKVVQRGGGFKGSLTLRRNLQKALTAYSKGKKYDKIQESLIGILAQIEKWFVYAYVKWRLPQLVTADYTLLKKGKRFAKDKARVEAFKILKDNSY